MKYLSISFLALVIGVFTFVSCAKEPINVIETVSNDKLSVEQIRADLSAINKKYKTTSRVNWRYWAGVAAADLTAAAVGAEYGMCCPPYGPAAGGSYLED